MTNGRIRVLVAGDVYVNRSLVRPFLEDDGYEVVGEPLTRDEALTAVGAQQPDAVVIEGTAGAQPATARRGTGSSDASRSRRARS